MGATAHPEPAPTCRTRQTERRVSEANWKRSVGRSKALGKIGRPDLHGHLVDDNLWAAARRVDEATWESGGPLGGLGRI
ncbi:MAG: hypothetical protein ACRDO7_13605 [Nocardioidaceae bacterium]